MQVPPKCDSHAVDCARLGHGVVVNANITECGFAGCTQQLCCNATVSTDPSDGWMHLKPG